MPDSEAQPTARGQRSTHNPPKTSVLDELPPAAQEMAHWTHEPGRINKMVAWARETVWKGIELSHARNRVAQALDCTNFASIAAEYTGTPEQAMAAIQAYVPSDEREGAFTATRVYAKSVIGGKPLVKMYALDKRTRREDPLPMIVDEPVETATLREWFPATLKPLSVDEDGSLIYQHDPDSGVSVTVVYQQQGGHKTVKSVRFYEAPNTASEDAPAEQPALVEVPAGHASESDAPKTTARRKTS